MIHYSLQLNDGTWDFAASDHEKGWIHNFAHILNLQKGTHSCSNQIYFNFKDPDTLHEKPNLTSNAEIVYQGLRWKSKAAQLLWSGKSVHPNMIECELAPHENLTVTCMQMWYSLFPVYHASICNKGLPVHAALGEFEKKGYIFAANSDVGKSTTVRRLPAPWIPLCDDHVLITFGASSTPYQAHPFPTWSDIYNLGKKDKSWNVSYSTPVKAIFFLEQAPDDQMIALQQKDTILRLYGSVSPVYWRFIETLDSQVARALRKQIFDNAVEMGKRIEGYILRLSLDGEFWNLINDHIR